MDDSPDTPRVCQACGGPAAHAEDKAPCPWCTNGFQDRPQQRAWRRFRSRMRHVSSTYSFLEESVHEFLQRLDTLDTAVAHDFSLRGTSLLDARAQANGTAERRIATERLSAWHKEVMDYLLTQKLASKP